MSDELSLDEIDIILAESEPKGRTGSRGQKDPTKTRDVQTWFKLNHTGERSCEVKRHDESRPRNKGMVTVINDVAVCRVCFLAGTDKE